MAGKMSALRILVADDHDILRRGVRVTLEDNPNWKVVAEASDGQEAIEKAKAFEPDVVILDFSMPKLNGLDAAREIVRSLPQTRVLMLTIYDSDDLIHELRQAGVHGYIRKSESQQDHLISAVKALVTNKPFFPPSITPNTHRPFKSDRRHNKPRLTTRQKEIVKLLAQGIRSEKIAGMLGISRKTVETHRQNIFLKTNCHSTANLVRYAIRNGIIEP
jgi:DNA-binding NarL/FixJ family response regulator